MKSDFYRWLTVFIVLMIIMSLSSFLALFIKPVVFYFETGSINISVINTLFLSIKIGSFVSGIIVIGLWIKHRFNIH
jgi:glycerol-3-phosphate acyltransferase PlsY